MLESDFDLDDKALPNEEKVKVLEAATSSYTKRIILKQIANTTFRFFFFLWQMRRKFIFVSLKYRWQICLFSPLIVITDVAWAVLGMALIK